ncbi:MAG: hypothetical protein SVR94_16430 [Pseudomonadota bacterium]|nr:hypothetical protein [Pseudomonadota bacterium]
MLIDWILMIALFFGFGYSATRAENRLRTGASSRRKAILELSSGNILAVLICFSLAIIFRELQAIPLDDIVNVRFLSVVGSGLLFSYIMASLRLWKKN